MKINELSLDFREKTSIFAGETAPKQHENSSETTENKEKRLQNIWKQGQNKTKTMAKQSKNRVKLDKEKGRLGVFTQPQLMAIRRVYKDVPGNAKRIRANISNSIKHNKEHLDQTERYLEQLGLTKEQYIRFIASNFNQIRRGRYKNTVVLAFCDEDLDHIAAVHLVFDKNENYWLVKSVRVSRKEFFKEEDLIWEKK